MTAIVTFMVFLHAGLCRSWRSVVVAAERHASRSESLQREPQQQKAQYEFAQAVFHVIQE